MTKYRGDHVASMMNNTACGCMCFTHRVASGLGMCDHIECQSALTYCAASVCIDKVHWCIVQLVFVVAKCTDEWCVCFAQCSTDNQCGWWCTNYPSNWKQMNW